MRLGKKELKGATTPSEGRAAPYLRSNVERDRVQSSGEQALSIGQSERDAGISSHC